MKTTQPSIDTLKQILNSAYPEWERLYNLISSLYSLNNEWYTAGKGYKYELKFRKGAKTVVALFVADNKCSLMLIYGSAEREKFEAIRPSIPADIQTIYDNAKTYHDGKWIMFESEQLSNEVLIPLLAIKRKADNN